MKVVHAQVKVEHAQVKVVHAQMKVEYAQYKFDHAQLEIIHAQVKIEHAQLEIVHAQHKLHHAQMKLSHAQYKLDHARRRTGINAVEIGINFTRCVKIMQRQSAKASKTDCAGNLNRTRKYLFGTISSKRSLLRLGGTIK